MEWWCMLKELKACADNLRHTLFAGKKHITMFYFRELPDNKGPKSKNKLFINTIYYGYNFIQLVHIIYYIC
ncbi:hypothetical protein EB796_001147 [Bugula neritina]|uniref:Uncharacterized protein n=1 Tax=Bugula neritina TaxID=10212 RepID=A0A7J7KQT4_BUGNE|nr:hypothetical protein EB796_001147 [Bugula neritina]